MGRERQTKIGIIIDPWGYLKMYCRQQDEGDGRTGRAFNITDRSFHSYLYIFYKTGRAFNITDRSFHSYIYIFYKTGRALNITDRSVYRSVGKERHTKSGIKQHIGEKRSELIKTEREKK